MKSFVVDGQTSVQFAEDLEKVLRQTTSWHGLAPPFVGLGVDNQTLTKRDRVMPGSELTTHNEPTRAGRPRQLPGPVTRRDYPRGSEPGARRCSNAS